MMPTVLRPGDYKARYGHYLLIGFGVTSKSHQALNTTSNKIFIELKHY